MKTPGLMQKITNTKNAKVEPTDKTESTKSQSNKLINKHLLTAKIWLDKKMHEAQKRGILKSHGLNRPSIL